MKITKLGPTENFAAVNPPNWLWDDLSLLAGKYPHLRVLVTFADDLPANPDKDLSEQYKFSDPVLQEKLFPSRREAAAALLKQHFKYDQLTAVLETHEIAGEIGGLYSNIRFHASASIDPLTGKKCTIYHNQEQPEPCAWVILPPRDMPAHEFSQVNLGIPSMLTARPDGVNIHRAVLGHEFGHMLNRLKPKHAFTRRTDEKDADKGVQELCAMANDAASRDYFFQWRALHNFAGGILSGNPMFAQCPDYWHDLHFAGIHAPDSAEYTANLEVRARSCAIDSTLPSAPSELIAIAFNRDAAPKLHVLMEGMSTVERLRILLEEHDKPYKSPHGEQLASRVISAAYQLAPGVFR